MERKQPTLTFMSLLELESVELAQKWYHNKYCTCYGAASKPYSNSEIDALNRIATQARDITERKRYL